MDGYRKREYSSGIGSYRTFFIRSLHSNTPTWSTKHFIPPKGSLFFQPNIHTKQYLDRQVLYGTHLFTSWSFAHLHGRQMPSSPTPSPENARLLLSRSKTEVADNSLANGITNVAMLDVWLCRNGPMLCLWLVIVIPPPPWLSWPRQHGFLSQVRLTLSLDIRTPSFAQNLCLCHAFLLWRRQRRYPTSSRMSLLHLHLVELTHPRQASGYLSTSYRRNLYTFEVLCV